MSARCVTNLTAQTAEHLANVGRIMRDNTIALTVVANGRETPAMTTDEGKLGTCDRKLIFNEGHVGPHIEIPERYQGDMPFPCENWKPLEQPEPGHTCSTDDRRLPIDRPCSACSAGDSEMEYHLHCPPFRPEPSEQRVLEQCGPSCPACGTTTTMQPVCPKCGSSPVCTKATTQGEGLTAEQFYHAHYTEGREDPLDTFKFAEVYAAHREKSLRSEVERLKGELALAKMSAKEEDLGKTIDFLEDENEELRAKLEAAQKVIHWARDAAWAEMIDIHSPTGWGSRFCRLREALADYDKAGKP